MRRISEIGAAVIGSGFIGTVHIEALRRLGVTVHGILGSAPDRTAARAAELGVPRAYASLAVVADAVAESARAGRWVEVVPDP
jgi:predicted dehydrogenase